MNCPNCGAQLRERDRAGIKIDFCPDCKGVWLDRGELDKIIEREASGNDWDGDRRRRDDDDDDDDRREDRYRSQPGAYPLQQQQYPKKSKRKSFFESITEMVGGGED